MDMSIGNDHTDRERASARCGLRHRAGAEAVETAPARCARRVSVKECGESLQRWTRAREWGARALNYGLSDAPLWPGWKPALGAPPHHNSVRRLTAVATRAYEELIRPPFTEDVTHSTPRQAASKM